MQEITLVPEAPFVLRAPLCPLLALQGHTIHPKAWHHKLNAYPALLDHIVTATISPNPPTSVLQDTIAPDLLPQRCLHRLRKEAVCAPLVIFVLETHLHLSLVPREPLTI